ncbi:Alpha-1,3-mannosyltransferase-like protein [Onygenales sp. PD_40]|nr:Alpha-1,3-mannosyltransferase-like protein [Onygenales sp. PD_40]
MTIPRLKITLIHPDLGIGGAERLILDVALALQARGHTVTIYTSHRDRSHCFEEARDGTLDVRVRGDAVFPDQIGGRGRVAMAVLRQVGLVVGGWWEGWGGEGDKEEGDEIDEVFIVDQVPACIPLLKMVGSKEEEEDTGDGKRTRRRRRQRILFYCHFPDQLLARRDEGGVLRRLVKAAYRVPFDWFEGWAMGKADKVVANSRFTCGVVRRVFGAGLGGGEVRVVYPCVDTGGAVKVTKEGGEGSGVAQGELWGGKKILLSINRFERKKDIALAIRAYHGLGEEGRKGTRLVIAGGYDNRVSENVQYHTELDDLASALSLHTATSKTVISALSIPDSIDVLFLLSVPSAFKQTLLASATLLLYTPSHEHFGIVPVEAMHAGLPVLAVNTGGPLETIVEGETGWLRDSRDIEEWTSVMRRVLWEMDPAELEGMGRKGRERVEREFSLTAMGDRLEGEIREMFEKPAREFGGLWVAVMVGLAVCGVGVAVLVAALLRLR